MKTKNPTKIVCPSGCEFSSDYDDYSFWLADDHKFTCEHNDKNFPCQLIEKIPVEGTDEFGRDYAGFHWTVLANEATVGDLKEGDVNDGE